jgi:hypothetical protein
MRRAAAANPERSPMIQLRLFPDSASRADSAARAGSFGGGGGGPRLCLREAALRVTAPVRRGERLLSGEGSGRGTRDDEQDAEGTIRDRQEEDRRRTAVLRYAKNAKGPRVVVDGRSKVRRSRKRLRFGNLGRHNGNADGNGAAGARLLRAGSTLPFLLSRRHRRPTRGFFRARGEPRTTTDDDIVDDRRLATAVALGSLSY